MKFVLRGEKLNYYSAVIFHYWKVLLTFWTETSEFVFFRIGNV